MKNPEPFTGEDSQSTLARAVFDFMGQTWSLSLLLFTLVLLNSLSQVTGNCISEGVSFLNKTQGDDVLFQLHPKVGNQTQRIRFYLESKNLLLLTTYPGESNSSWIIPQKEYEGRLSAPDDKSLMLMNATSEDSGCYEIHTSSVSGDIHIQKFNLTVFDTVSSESHMNSWISIVIPALVLVVLITVCAYLQIRWKILNKIKGFYRRRNLPPGPNHREERSLEEGCVLVQETSLSVQETQTRTHGALSTTVTEKHEGAILARVCTPQESSPDSNSPTT